MQLARCGVDLPLLVIHVDVDDAFGGGPRARCCPDLGTARRVSTACEVLVAKPVMNVEDAQYARTLEHGDPV